MAGTRLTIDLDEHQGEDCPRGRVGRVDEKTTRDFVGWLDLVTALDALISGPPTAWAARRGEAPATDGKRG